MGKSSINGQFSMAMLNNQRVCLDLNISLLLFFFLRGEVRFLTGFGSPMTITISKIAGRF